MLNRAFISLALVGLLVAFSGTARVEEQVPATISECRHNQNSTRGDRDRRAEAFTLAKAINTAQAESVRRTQRYQPLASLSTLPQTPAGFTVSLYAGADGYIFAIKDTLDPCRFAVFSDSAGLLYESSAYNAPVIAR